ncbi:MAG: hypothetical protein MJZ64_06090 [Paludibacteraceae bacterium]|nr:hypothetical protein [Paludibacteraceae bacterium]
MKILIAPLNWGLGHATRCVALVRRYMSEGHEVVLGGDGESLVWLKRYFPNLRYVELASLELTYSKGKSQVWAMLRALPKLIRFSLEDEARLEQLLRTEPFDLVVSDNRFGLYSQRTRCVYMTHQLWIRLPRFWHWLEPLAARLHAQVYNKYSEVWVPDYEQKGLSGILGHPKKVSDKVKYIGPLSRFGIYQLCSAQTTMASANNNGISQHQYHVVALLSGLEPQRSIFEQQVLAQMAQQTGKHLLVQGKVKKPFTKLQHGNITVVPWLGDDELAAALLGAEQIICRSGYSTIMDLERLGVLGKAVFYPTPGQPEQAYLAEIHTLKTAKSAKK